MSFKSTLLTAALGISFLSPVFADNTSNSDWSASYTIDTYNNTYEFTHTPDQVCLLSEHLHMCAGENLTFNPNASFNGDYLFVNTLELRSDMTQEEFEDALKRATGISTISW